MKAIVQVRSNANWEQNKGKSFWEDIDIRMMGQLLHQQVVVI